MSEKINLDNLDPKIKNKLENIFKLHESAKKINQLGEAQAALTAFRRIIAKYNIDIDEETFKERISDVKAKTEVREDILYGFKERRTFWIFHLCINIANFFRCKVYQRSYRGIGPNGYKYELIVVGFQSDIEVVKYITSAFLQICEKCVKNYIEEIKKIMMNEFGTKMNTKKRSEIKNDYLVGFIDGVVKAFEEQDKNEEEVALALVTPTEVLESYNNAIIPASGKKPKMAKAKTIANRSFNPKIYFAGYADGYNTGKNKDRRLEGSE